MVRYYISFDEVDWDELYPDNEPVITEEKNGEMFTRYAVDSFKITRFGGRKVILDSYGKPVVDSKGNKLYTPGNQNIYDTLNSYFFDGSKMGELVYWKMNVDGTDKYYFKGSINQGGIDTEKGTYTANPEADDAYRPIIELYDKTFQDRNTGGFMGVSDSIYFPFDNNDTFTNVSYNTFSDTDNGVGIPNNVVIFDASGTGGIARQQLNFTPANGDYVQIYITAKSGTRAVTGDIVNQTFTSCSVGGAQGLTDVNVFTFEITRAPSTVYFQLSNAGLVDATLSYLLYYCDLVGVGGAVENVIPNLLTGLSYMDLDFTVSSTFLWNDALGSDPPPDIDTYITANPTKDYVVEGNAIMNDLCLMKVDLFTTDTSPVLELSFKELMDMFKQKLRVWWHIDEDGAFRLEHEKYYRNFDSQLSLSSYSQFKPEIDVLQYEYDRNNLFSEYKYTETNDNNADFVPYTFAYSPIKTSFKSKDVAIYNLSTDVEHIQGNPDIDSSGYLLLQCTKHGSDYIISVNKSEFSTQYFVNQRMSFAYLFKHYFSYFGDADEATINNGKTLSINHVKEFLKQKEISLYYEGDLDWRKPITTENGTGWIEKWTRDENGFYKIDVGYNPYA